MPTLRILQVVTLSERGGAQRHVADLTRGLVGRGHELHVACAPGGFLVAQARAAGAVVHEQTRLVREIRPLRDLLEFFELVRLMRRVRPALVHAHSSKAGILARLAAWVTGTPSLYTAHGLVFLEPLSPIRRALYLATEWLGGRLGGRLIAVSKRDEQAARRWRLARPERLVTIPNGYEPSGAPLPAPDNPPFLRGNPGAKAPHWFPPSPSFRFGALANPYPTKGLDVLVAAVRGWPSGAPPIQVAVAGDGPERPALERAASGLPIRFLGRVEDVEGFFASIHCAIQPSLKEGWPYSVLEAMGAGRPVIATDVGGMADQVGDGEGGWIVPSGDAVALAHAMREAASDPAEARRRGAASHRRVRERFPLEPMLDRVEEEYRAVLVAERGPRIPLRRRAPGRSTENAGVSADASSEGRPHIVFLSPSSSRGMSHYAHALAEATEAHADVTVLDAARGVGFRRMRRELRRLARRRNVFVLNTSPHWSAPLLALVRGVRGGHILHDPMLNAPTRFGRPLHITYYRWLTRRLRVVVLHAKRFRRHVGELGLKPADVVVVPHGFVPHEMVRPAPYDPSGPVALIGRLLPYKGYDVLVAALRILKDEGLEIPALVGGEGVTSDHARPELPALEVYEGLLEDDLFVDLMVRCSAVVLPYLKASQSGVLATAFCMGRPVIASAIGSFPDYITDDHNGLLVPPGDAPRLARALARFRSDPGRARAMAVNARKTWEEELQPQRCAQRIVAALVAATKTSEP